MLVSYLTRELSHKPMQLPSTHAKKENKETKKVGTTIQSLKFPLLS